MPQAEVGGPFRRGDVVSVARSHIYPAPAGAETTRFQVGGIRLPRALGHFPMAYAWCTVSSAVLPCESTALARSET